MKFILDRSVIIWRGTSTCSCHLQILSRKYFYFSLEESIILLVQVPLVFQVQVQVQVLLQVLQILLRTSTSTVPCTMSTTSCQTRRNYQVPGTVHGTRYEVQVPVHLHLQLQIDVLYKYVLVLVPTHGYCCV